MKTPPARVLRGQPGQGRQLRHRHVPGQLGQGGPGRPRRQLADGRLRARQAPAEALARPATRAAASPAPRKEALEGFVRSSMESAEELAKASRRRERELAVEAGLSRAGRRRRRRATMLAQLVQRGRRRRTDRWRPSDRGGRTTRQQGGSHVRRPGPTGVELIAPTGFDLFTEEVRLDPYPIYRRYRETEPDARAQRSMERTWILTPLPGLLDGAARPRLSSSPAHRDRRWAPPTWTSVRRRRLVPGPAVPRPARPHPAAQAGEQGVHAADRRALCAAHPELVDGILDQAAERGGLDVVADLGYRGAGHGDLRAPGRARRGPPTVRPWSSDASRLLDGVQDADDHQRRSARRPCRSSTTSTACSTSAAPTRGDDLVERAAGRRGRRRPAEPRRSCASIVILLFIAGHETTMNLIGNGTKALLEHPDQLRRLARRSGLDADRDRGAAALRRPGPRHRADRHRATRGRRAHLRAGRAGDRAAGRGQPGPGALRAIPTTSTSAGPTTSTSPSPTGIHYCLGAALARVEGQVAIGSPRAGGSPTWSSLADPRVSRPLRPPRPARAARFSCVGGEAEHGVASQVMWEAGAWTSWSRRSGRSSGCRPWCPA